MSSESTARALILLGGGGHASVVADSARAADWRVIGFFDDDPAAQLPELVRLGSIDDAGAWCADNPEAAIHAAVGEPMKRSDWLAHCGDVKRAIIVHPSAVISSSASIEPGVFIAPRAVINARARIGAGAIINTGAIVEHDVRVGAFAHVAPGAVVGGGASVSARALVGLGARVLPGVQVGEDATLGAGATATAAVGSSAVAVGTPARVQ